MHFVRLPNQETGNYLIFVVSSALILQLIKLEIQVK